MKEENNKRIALRIDEKTYEAIKKSAIKNNSSVSDEIRKALKEYLKISQREEHIDETVMIIDEVIEAHIKKLGNRLASLLNKNTIISASGYFTLLTLLSEILSPSMQNSFKQIEQRSRKLGLEYANAKTAKPISDFLEDFKIEDVCDTIKSDVNLNENIFEDHF